jgi:SAM-dependent methyltransferase
MSKPEPLPVTTGDSPETREVNVAEPLTGHTPHGGYDPSFFDELALVEDRHFWFRARNRLIFEISKKIHSGLKSGHLVLEVGCGTGNVLRVLDKAYPEGKVVGLELWLDGLRYAQKRSNSLLIQGDIRCCPFAKQFDVIGMFDVLEHIDEDLETLLCLNSLLVPGGWLLLTVPAHLSLWSYFDEAAHHCRRYSPQEIRKKLTSAGFEVEFESQFMATIFPIVWSFRKISGLRRRSGSEAKTLAAAEFRLVPFINGILTVLLSLEARWVARGHRSPIGTSLVVIARKPGATESNRVHGPGQG